MTRKAHGRKRRRWYAILALTVFLLGVEIVARITAREPGVHPMFLEVSRDFAGLESLLADRRRMGANKYYEEFLYASAPLASDNVNFTDYYSARLTPSSVPLSEAEHIVWTFGGSTMQNLETTDSLTIANTWAFVFNRELGPTHVVNLGTGAFNSSYELIKFQKLLREVPRDELPTMSVFYDGYNDAFNAFQGGAGSMQYDLSMKLQALVERRFSALSAYGVSQVLSGYFRAWERTGHRALEGTMFPPPRLRLDEENLETAVRVYASNTRMIEATCVASQIECFFILQPLILTKAPLVGAEIDVIESMERNRRFGGDGIRFVKEFYARTVSALGDEPRFIDASDILDGRPVADFYDLGHVAAGAPPIIGEKLAYKVLERLRRVTAAPGEKP